MRNHPLLVCASVFLLLLGSVCGGDKQKDLVGKWFDSETGEVTEYRVDGKMAKLLATGDVIAGRYWFADDSHLRIRLDSTFFPMFPVTIAMTLSGDDLEVTGPDQKPKKLKRIKEDRN